MKDNKDLLKCLWQDEMIKEDPQRLFGMMHLAATIPDSQCLKYLSKKATNLNEPISESDLASPLHFAVLSNQLSNCEILLSRGASPNH